MMDLNHLYILQPLDYPRFELLLLLFLLYIKILYNMLACRNPLFVDDLKIYTNVFSTINQNSLLWYPTKCEICSFFCICITLFIQCKINDIVLLSSKTVPDLGDKMNSTFKESIGYVLLEECLIFGLSNRNPLYFALVRPMLQLVSNI